MRLLPARLTSFIALRRKQLAIAALFVLLIAGLLLYRLASLTSGLSQQEFLASFMPVGWHGIYHQALNLPLLFVRSVAFWLDPDHGALTSRLPNALFGGLAITSFGLLVRGWLGNRIALFATLLFACSAWTLHVSRYVSFDVLYLWAIPTVLLLNNWLHRYGTRSRWVLPAVTTVMALMLYIPGMLWFLYANALLQRKTLLACWRAQSTGGKVLTTLAKLIWIPFLVVTLTRPGNLRTWLGLPDHFASPSHILKEIVAVPVHAFVRGPEIPTLWLGKAPVLDIFCLVAALLGVYFYITHLGAKRARLLLAFGIIGAVLIGLGGPVGLSAIIPLLYILVATGIAFLLREWLQTFPVNPLARGFGVGLISLLVVLSCIYNVRSYFIAWPHNATTQALFRYVP